MAQEVVKMAQEITTKEAPEEALSIVLKTYLEQKIAECTERIKHFEKKYGMSFNDFYEKLGEEFSLSWEHEEDYMDWEAATTNREYFKEAFEKLREDESQQIHE
jgi:hypothetical protein